MLDFCLTKTRSGKSRDYRDVIVFAKCFLSTRKQKASTFKFPRFEKHFRKYVRTFTDLVHQFINLPRLPTLSSRSRDLSPCCRCGGTAVYRVSEHDLHFVLFQTMSEEYPKREGPCWILKLAAKIQRSKP